VLSTAVATSVLVAPAAWGAAPPALPVRAGWLAGWLEANANARDLRLCRAFP
jgi:hypothetical protein